MSEGLKTNLTGSNYGPLEVQNYQQIQQIQGYTAGMENAIQTFHRIIVVLWIAQTAMIFTTRFLRRDNFFSIELNHPLSGVSLYYWEPERDIEIPEKWVKRLDNIAFTLAYALSSYLLALQYFPAYKVTGP